MLTSSLKTPLCTLIITRRNNILSICPYTSQVYKIKIAKDKLIPKIGIEEFMKWLIPVCTVGFNCFLNLVST